MPTGLMIVEDIDQHDLVGAVFGGSGRETGAHGLLKRALWRAVHARQHPKN